MRRREFLKAAAGTVLLPEPLRHDSGHMGSHTFLTHEFIDALAHSRKPAIDIYESLAYTVPGIIAHESALRGGQLMKIPQFDPAGTKTQRKTKT